MNKRYPVFLFLLIYAFAVYIANAATGNERWKLIAGKNGHDRTLYDPGSVIPLRPGVYRVWIMSFEKDHSPRKSLLEVDCANKIVRELEVITEKPNNLVQHTFTPSDWRGIEREYTMGELSRIICR